MTMTDAEIADLLASATPGPGPRAQYCIVVPSPEFSDGEIVCWAAKDLPFCDNELIAMAPTLARLALDRGKEIERLRAALDAAYEERNRVVAALAVHYPAGTARPDIAGWEPEWLGCVYIDTPHGQVSWHFHDSQAHLFAHLPAYPGQWDGHDTPEKYRRVAAIARAALNGGNDAE